MLLSLVPHPDNPVSPVDSIGVDAVRDGARLRLSYRVVGRIDALRIPDRLPSMRRDELWRHSCLEAFVGLPSKSGYYEFNVSPSTEWAAYGFTGYREGMTDLAVPAPGIQVRHASDWLDVEVDLDLGGLLPPADVWVLGLTAVIEQLDGERGFWSLRHADGQPDFHHRDCFALQLPPAKTG